MLLAVTAWGGVSYAQTGPYKSLTFPDENRGNNGNGSYTERWTAQIGDDSWTIDCFNNNRWNSWTYIKCGRKKVASTASITTNFPIDQPIEDVVVTIDKITASYVNSITLEVANDNDFANIVETVKPTEISTGDMTFKINEPKENLYYKLVFDCNGGSSSNGFIQISKVEYRTSEYISKKQTELSFGSEIDGQTLTVTEGEEASFDSPTATLIPAEAGSVTYSSDNEAVAKVNATTGAISFGELGTAKITASFAGNDAYGASSASYTIRYIAPIAENALVFDAENGAFENVKNSGGYDAYNNEAVALIAHNGTECSFMLNKAYQNDGGIQLKRNEGTITSPTFGFANGYTVIVTTSTNDIKITSGDLEIEGANNSARLNVPTDATFTIETNGKYAVVTKIEVIPNNSSTVTVTPPTFSLESGFYTEAQSITLSAADGCTIYYTTDGKNPNNTSTTYTAPIGISETTTIKAIAYDAEGNVSSVVTRDYEFPVICENIAAAKNVEDGTIVKVILTDAQVLFANETDIMLRDASGAIDLYQIGIEGLTTNNIVNGSIIATTDSYLNMPELTSNDHTSTTDLTITDGEPAEPKDVASLTDATNYVCDLVRLNGNVTSEQSGQYTNYYINDAEGNRVQLYDKFRIDGFTAPYDGAAVEVTGIIVPYRDVMEICPTTTTDIKYILNETANNAVDDAANATVRLVRTLSSEYWNTFCVPFGISAEQVSEVFGEGTKITEFKGEMDGTTMKLDNATEIVAGVPYLIKPAQTVENPQFEGVTIVSGEPLSISSKDGSYKFTGVYSPTKLTVGGTDLFIATDGSLKQPAVNEENANLIKGMRAYITIPAGVDMKAVKLSIDGELTGIKDIDAETTTADSKIYDLNGRYMGTDTNGLSKGVYIMNGKKITIK